MSEKVYIEKEAAIAAGIDAALEILDAADYQKHPNEVAIPVRNIMREAMATIPPADVRPVVLCKDCKHRPRGKSRFDLEFPDDVCPCQIEDYWYSWQPKDDWFCANGERRTE